MLPPPTDVLVVGAGLAGLAAGWQAAKQGARTRVIAKGWGALYWHTGCIDVLGYHPLDAPAPLDAPVEGLARLVEDRPDHPYALVGSDRMTEALEALRELSAAAGYPLLGSLDRNRLLPSALGAFRPTCLAPQTMVAGDLARPDPMLIVGFPELPDFYPALAADNLSVQGVSARAEMLDLPSLRGRRFTTTAILAGLFDRAEFRREVAGRLRPRLGDEPRVGFPAVLGLRRATECHGDLQDRLGREVFEIPTLPASVPGMRLHRLLVEAVEVAGGSVFEGMEALSCVADDGRVTAVGVEAAARRRSERSRVFVLATGGVLGGGIQGRSDGSLGERVFDLPVAGPGDRRAWFGQDFLDGHPVYRAGVRVSPDLRPVDGDGEVMFGNLWAAGGTLAGADPLRERSLEGVALATGLLAGRDAAGGSRA